MIKGGEAPRDLSGLVVLPRGSLEATGDLFQPYRLIDAEGVLVVPAAAYFRELAACGRPAATHRSYGMDLLRWWRFLWTVEIGWDQATSAEARDFCCWIGLADKPARPHWRYPGGGAPGTRTAGAPGTPKPGDRQAVAWPRLCGGDGGALRERAARLFWFPPGGRHRADG